MEGILTSWKMDSPWAASCIWCWCCCCVERRCSRFADCRHIVIISVHANIFKWHFYRTGYRQTSHEMRPTQMSEWDRCDNGCSSSPPRYRIVKWIDFFTESFEVRLNRVTIRSNWFAESRGLSGFWENWQRTKRTSSPNESIWSNDSQRGWRSFSSQYLTAHWLVILGCWLVEH